VRHDRIHERLASSSSAIRLEDEHVAEPRKRRAIRHHARERDLRRALTRIALEDGETEGPLDGAIHDISWDARRPVRLIVKKTPHEVAIHVSRVARNDVLPHAPRV
jgi:hypothetical protein